MHFHPNAFKACIKGHWLLRDRQQFLRTGQLWMTKDASNVHRCGEARCQKIKPEDFLKVEGSWCQEELVWRENWLNAGQSLWWPRPCWPAQATQPSPRPTGLFLTRVSDSDRALAVRSMNNPRETFGQFFLTFVLVLCSIASFSQPSLVVTCPSIPTTF